MPPGIPAFPAFDPSQVAGDPISASQGLSLRDQGALKAIGSDYLNAFALSGGCNTNNLIVDSEDFTTANWTATHCTAAKNAATSPRGDKTMNTITEDNQTNVHHVEGVAFTVTAYGTVACSIYAKANTRTWLVMGFEDAGGGGAYGQQFFDLTNGVLGTLTLSATVQVSTSIEDVGGGIFRCGIVLQRQSGTSIQFYAGLASADNADNYAGDGSSNLYIWGAQGENQSTSVHCYKPNPFGAAQGQVNWENITPQQYVQAAYEIGKALEAQKAIEDA